MLAPAIRLTAVPKGKNIKNQKLKGPGKAKAQEDDAEARRIVETIRRTAVASAVAPATAAAHPVGA